MELRSKELFILTPQTDVISERKRILLVDDVWTTGSTMVCAARTLRKAGYDVWFYTLAKG